MDKKTVKHINGMSFNELKNELNNCYDNPIKEKIIRELMVLKYNQYINAQHNRKLKLKQKQKQKQKQKHDSLQNKNPPINDNSSVVITPTPEVDFLDDFSFDDFNDEDYDDNNIIEYKKDINNNNLMDRMNSDMELKKMKVSTNKKDIIKPFVNTTCDTYATFKNEQGTDIKSFRK